jgi:hypothetical protein
VYAARVATFSGRRVGGAAASAATAAMPTRAALRSAAAEPATAAVAAAYAELRALRRPFAWVPHREVTAVKQQDAFAIASLHVSGVWRRTERHMRGARVPTLEVTRVEVDGAHRRRGFCRAFFAGVEAAAAADGRVVRVESVVSDALAALLRARGYVDLTPVDPCTFVLLPAASCSCS